MDESVGKGSIAPRGGRTRCAHFGSEENVDVDSFNFEPGDDCEELRASKHAPLRVGIQLHQDVQQDAGARVGSLRSADLGKTPSTLYVL